MKSKPSVEHENYKDELGDNDFYLFDSQKYGNAISAQIEDELFRSDYRPLLYEYFQIEREGSKRVKSYVKSIRNYLANALAHLRGKR